LNFFSKLLSAKKLKSDVLGGQERVKHEREPEEQGISMLNMSTEKELNSAGFP
jgi:hypothetical protein